MNLTEINRLSSPETKKVAREEKNSKSTYMQFVTKIEKWASRPPWFTLVPFNSLDILTSCLVILTRNIEKVTIGTPFNIPTPMASNNTFFSLYLNKSNNFNL